MAHLQQLFARYRLYSLGIAIGLAFSVADAQSVSTNQAVTSDLRLKPVLGTLPAWSPDGRKIAFSRGGGVNGQIFLMNVDGSNQTQLTHNSGDNRWLSWSHDSSKIAFSSDRDHPMSMEFNRPSRYEIYVINVNGTGERRLTFDNSQSLYPSWAPDGKSIAFTSGPDGFPGIYRIGADGSGQSRLSGDAEKFTLSAWSPNGAKFAMLKQGPFDKSIYLMNADGSGIVKLTTAPERPRYLSWSPDGSVIAFSAKGTLHAPECDHQPAQIYVLKVRSVKIKALTNDCDNNWGPSWSPDGEKIIFTVGMGNAFQSIHVIDADGDNKVQMTDVPVF